MRKKELPRAARVVLPALFWLAIWWCAAAWVGKALLLPPPSAVGRSLAALAVRPAFWQAAGASLRRVFLGFLAGAALGAVLAGITSVWRWADLILAPALRMIRATPVVCFILLLFLWVHTSLVPGVVAALMVLPVVWEAVARGVAETDPLLLEMAGAYGFGGWKTMRLLYVPSAAPYFAQGSLTALGLAWKSGVAAEVLCLPRLSIGTEIYGSKLALETADLFAWTAVLIALSFLTERLLRMGFKRMGGRSR